MNCTKNDLLALIHTNEGDAAKRYSSIAEKAAATTRSLIAGFRDQADWVSGWGHDFVCPNCAALLYFDENLDYKLGSEYTCTACGTKTSGRALDQAWVYYYRISLAEKLENAAVTALLGDADALAFLTRYFDFYAESYDGFELHPKAPSKLMPQLLDEAVWCTYVLRALYPCRSLFAKEKLEYWHEKLFRPLAHVILEPNRNHAINNHVLWHMSAVGMIALTFDDSSLMFAIDGEWGVRTQVEKGFTEDGFWFECSNLYHYYALEALTVFCQILADKAPNDPLLARLTAAYTVPMLTSYDGWHLPSMNDGWYPLTLARFAKQLHRAAWCSNSPALLSQLEAVKTHAPDLLDAPQALLLETAPAVTAMIPSAKLAVIRKPVFAILKSGVLATNHRHDDCLSVILPPISNDLGTPGYAHPLYGSWYVKAAAHNTFAVNGAQPHAVLPSHVESTHDSVRAVLDGGWEGVSAARTLCAEGDTLVDTTDISTETPCVIDWFFHFEGVTDISSYTAEPAALGNGEGYEHFSNVQRITCSTLTVHAEREGETATVTIPVSDMEAYLAQSPGNPAGNLRTSVILRYHGNKAHFVAKITK